MKIAVFGASGKSGIPFVQQALERGHELVASVRTPSKFPIQHPKLTVVQGDVLNPEDVERACQGCEAVVSLIGHTSKSPNDLQTKGISNVIQAMQKNNIKRLISLTGAGVKCEKDVQQGAISRFFEFLLKMVAKAVLEDGINHAKLIAASDLDWTIVRGPRLTEGAKVGGYRTGYYKYKKPMISRADLADFILNELEKNEYIREYPLIGF